jgi:hypothetical protein
MKIDIPDEYRRDNNTYKDAADFFRARLPENDEADEKSRRGKT